MKEQHCRLVSVPAEIEARAAYNDFFTLWKNADPHIPILKQAKAEYVGSSDLPLLWTSARPLTKP